MNIVFQPAPAGTTHFLRYASGYVVWCKVEAGQNNQLILSEWDSGNEYWVPGIWPIEHYQRIGLTSIEDLPTQSEVEMAVAPKGATHCYQHGGETSWYRETEDNLFVWRDGSWYASTQKSARDLAKVCPFGAVTTLTQEVQLAEYSKDDLTWLARNAHSWNESAYAALPGGVGRVLWVSGAAYGQKKEFKNAVTKDQWLARRAELQNKPSWEDAPEWACYLGQSDEGAWHWFDGEPEINEVHDSGEFWNAPGYTAITDQRGEVLGDWRDTLERRPVDLSEPAGGAKERSADGAEELNAMAQRLPVALKSDPRSFDTGAIAEMVELADAEIVKRDAAVCGGEGYLNNHWFERGELPPVGVECEFHGGLRVGREWPNSLKDGAKVKVLCHYTPCMRPVAVFSFDIPGGKLTSQASEACFRPIRTEHDRLMSILAEFDGSPVSVGRIADAILTDGFKRDGGVK